MKKRIHDWDKNKISVGIIGSCVLRDMFEFPKTMPEYEAIKSEYVVERFVQSINPLAAVSPNLDPAYAEALVHESTLSTASNFYKRNFKLDVEKSWDDYLAQLPSDWLLIDLSTIRLNVHRVGSTYVTMELEDSMTKGLSDLSSAPNLMQLKNAPAVEMTELSEKQLQDVFEAYYKRLLDIYPQKKIVFFDVKHVFSYMDEDGEFVSSPNERQNSKYATDNGFIELARQVAKKCMPKAHFVDTLPVLVGEVNHKWGKCGLHYVDEVYWYLLRSFDLIAHKSNREELAREMMELKLSVSQRIFERYARTVNHCVQRSRNILKLEQGVTPGTYEKNGLTLTVTKDFRFRVQGVAKDETIFYLYSGHKNPCGEWKSVQDTTEAGTYMFTTRMHSVANKCYVQLVLTTEDLQQRWIIGDLSAWIKLDTAYTYRLVRLVVCRGERVDASGRLCLERLG